MRYVKHPAIRNILPDGDFAFLLAEIIQTGKINRQAIESELKRRGWLYTDVYRVASIYPSYGDFFISSLDYFSKEMTRHFPATFAFLYQDTIIAVINETHAVLNRYFEQFSIFIGKIISASDSTIYQ